MPDSIGRKNLAELRADVYRWLSAVQPAVTNPDGSILLEGCTDPLYPPDAINMALNLSLTGHFIDLTVDGDKMFSDETLIDVEQNVTEYTLPNDMAFLHGCWWLDPYDDFSYNPQNASDSDTGRLYMYPMEEPISGEGDAIENGAPRYRRQMNYIVLDRNPLQNKVGGILVRYVKWIAPLQDAADSYVESQFAPLLQEIIVLDAVKNLSATMAGTDLNVITAELAKWEGRLVAAARMSSAHPFMQLVVPQINRRRFARRWR